MPGLRALESVIRSASCAASVRALVQDWPAPLQASRLRWLAPCIPHWDAALVRDACEARADWEGAVELDAPSALARVEWVVRDAIRCQGRGRRGRYAFHVLRPLLARGEVPGNLWDDLERALEDLAEMERHHLREMLVSDPGASPVALVRLATRPPMCPGLAGRLAHHARADVTLWVVLGERHCLTDPNLALHVAGQTCVTTSPPLVALLLQSATHDGWAWAERMVVLQALQRAIGTEMLVRPIVRWAPELAEPFWEGLSERERRAISPTGLACLLGRVPAGARVAIIGSLGP